MTLRNALLHLRACRPIAFPNIGFLVQLKAYGSTIFGCCSDVPLKLEKLFGIESLPQEGEDERGAAQASSQATTSATTSEDGNSEEEKSEAKAINDATQQLGVLGIIARQREELKREQEAKQ